MLVNTHNCLVQIYRDLRAKSIAFNCKPDHVIICSTNYETSALSCETFLGNVDILLNKIKQLASSAFIHSQLNFNIFVTSLPISIKFYLWGWGKLESLHYQVEYLTAF